jgi:hypothetical protein
MPSDEVSLEDFLGGMASGTRRLTASCHHTSGYAGSDLPKPTPTCLTQDDHRLSSLSLPRPPIGQMFLNFTTTVTRPLLPEIGPLQSIPKDSPQ